MVNVTQYCRHDLKTTSMQGSRSFILVSINFSYMTSLGCQQQPTFCSSLYGRTVQPHMAQCITSRNTRQTDGRNIAVQEAKLSLGQPTVLPKIVGVTCPAKPTFREIYLCACSALPIQSCVSNLKSFARVVLKICSIVCQNCRGHVTQATSTFREIICAPTRHSRYKAAYQI